MTFDEKMKASKRHHSETLEIIEKHGCRAACLLAMTADSCRLTTRSTLIQLEKDRRQTPHEAKNGFNN
jgi:hypothetical protein